MATGSKRSSADSDLLLCHVGLWRTSRSKFGCVSGCEHSEMRFITVVPSAHRLHPRPPCTFSGRAGLRARICSAFSCDMFARVVWLRLRRVRDYRISFCYLPHALATHYFLRLTRARRTRFGRRTRESSLLTFGTFGHTKVQEKKSSFMILLFQSSFRLSEKNEKDKKRNALTPVSATPTHMLRICVNSRLALSAGVQACVHESARLPRALCSHAW